MTASVLSFLGRWVKVRLLLAVAKYLVNWAGTFSKQKPCYAVITKIDDYLMEHCQIVFAGEFS